jgi:hypothetical protein
MLDAEVCPWTRDVDLLLLVETAMRLSSLQAHTPIIPDMGGGAPSDGRPGTLMEYTSLAILA